MPLSTLRRLWRMYSVPELREVPGIQGRVHRFDFMIGGDDEARVEAYNRIGRSACQLIREALEATGREAEEELSVLDFGSGYGRVLRFLVDRFPAGQVTAFDPDSEAVRFCTVEFGARGLTFAPGSWDYESADFDTYDVIWLGSVLTHLSRAYTEETAAFLTSILAPGGVLVFTTHGEGAYHRLRQGFYGEEGEAQAERIIEETERDGLGFLPYPRSEFGMKPFNFQRKEDFGLTWMAPEHVRGLFLGGEVAAMRELFFRPLGWDHHQDVWAFQRQA